MLATPICGEGTPDREGVGVWKDVNSGNKGPVGVPPGVENGVDVAGDIWLAFGVGVLDTWLTSPGDSLSDMMILEKMELHYWSLR